MLRMVGRWLALGLFGLAWPVLSAAPPIVMVGERHGVAHTAAAAVRDATHRDDVRYTVWYPATDRVPETAVNIGPPTAPWFDVGSAAANADIAAGRFPVLLLSHGNGGTARMMGWFGIAMARRGYLVIAVDHPGNNGQDPMTVAGSTLIWERADDLKAVLRAVRADPFLAAHLDNARLAVAGFSAGGFTALVAAGARVDVSRFIAFCRTHPADGVCKPQRESPDITLVAHQAAAASPALAAWMRQAADDHSIPGIRAVFLMAPAIVQALDPATLKQIKLPVSIVLGAADDVAPPATNGEVVAAWLPRARLRFLPVVGHYDFLAACTEAGHARLGPLCDSQVAPQQTHAAAISQASEFFRQSLH